MLVFKFENQLDIDGVRMAYIQLRHENGDGTPEAYLKIVHSMMHGKCDFLFNFLNSLNIF